jgi:uncharacterized protein DUF5691
VTTYDELVAAATVGIAQRPLSITELPQPAGEHSPVLDADPAMCLLDAVALLDAAQRAGRLFATPIPLPEPAPCDGVPELPPVASLIVADLLRTGPAQLLGDLLSAAAHAGFRAAPALLPTLLSAAATNSALRDGVAATLGERGRWLAAQQPEWLRVVDSGVVPVAEDAWETGRFAERRSWLAQFRRHDPDAARGLLAEGWMRETGDDRAELITVLADRLSAADESFLEAALDDRRAEVRRRAAQLLQLLPGSAYQGRARGRAAEVLHLERRGVRRRLVVTLPDEADESARRDGLDVRPHMPRTGVRTWLLMQIVAAAPLELWTEILGDDPRDIVALPIADGFAPDVHAGWRRAAVRQRNAGWARALLDVSDHGPSDAELAAVLPHTERQARVVALLQRSAEAVRLLAEVQCCPPPWGPELAEAVLAYLERELRGGRSVPTGALLATVARALPTDYAAPLRRLAEEAPLTTGWPRALRRAADIVELRRRFHEELQ